ncbi:DUF669 domain-containing protein [uncultured Clostridium sp.]|uniref:DUF669 domain-containing protein n=1 Tax=uncultured Clostridium sp. TaxID=59620 RepID=UPI00258EE62F|nr:DUF669 domain-containing protein [uncultured Clostridium sp.]MDU1348296.1 DUF669 domain-containing protein [Clostridium argentinense]
MSIWDKFDKSMDIEGLKEDVKEVAENGGGNFKEVPHGYYEVKVEKMEPKVSKKGDPMLSIWFKVIEGEFKDGLIFYNQVLTTGFGIHNACEMLRSLDSGIEINFNGMSSFENLILDVHEAIDGKLEYQLSYTANKKNSNFSEYEVVDVFEV